MATTNRCTSPVIRWVSRGFDPLRDGYCIKVKEDCGVCGGCLSRLVIQMMISVVDGIDND